MKELNSIDSPAASATPHAATMGVPIGSSPAHPGTPIGTPIVAQSSKVVQLKKTKHQPPIGTLRNIRNVYNAVRDYKDGDGRQISDVFMKLPSKIFYPDYYEV